MNFLEIKIKTPCIVCGEMIELENNVCSEECLKISKKDSFKNVLSDTDKLYNYESLIDTISGYIEDIISYKDVMQAEYEIKQLIDFYKEYIREDY